jgi:hypothetical protein
MTEQDKPFVCYKSGLSIKIVPRNAAGWRAMAGWMLVHLLPTAGFVWAMLQDPSAAQIAAWTVGYLLVTLLWGIAMIRWAMPRSEIIEMKELLALKREREQAKRNGRR